MPLEPTAEQTTLAKQTLIVEIDRGELSMGQAVRRMRKITGKNQKDYARNIIGISPRVLAEIERDVANPTVDTLNKIGRPFGYAVGFVRKTRASNSA
jgi:DNA-binding XRE family transcriptional regulator